MDEIVETARMERAIAMTLNAARGAAGVSISELARRMGRPYDSTRNYLTGERSMPVQFLLAAAAALHIEPDEVLREARERYYATV